MAVVCDMEAEDDLSSYVEGADAIVFAAGAGPGSGAERKQTVDLGAAVKLIEAAQAAGVSRYVMVSAIGAPRMADEPGDMQPYFQAKAQADLALEESDLDHTIVRPGGLTDDPGTGQVTVAAELERGGQVTRDDVAAVVLAVLGEPTTRSARRSTSSRATRRSKTPSVRCSLRRRRASYGGTAMSGRSVRGRRRHDEVREAGRRREWDYPDMAREAGHEGARRRRHRLRRDRAGRRRLLLRRLDLRASAPSTSSGSPASRSTTSTTTARRARPRCSWRSSSSRAASPTACSRSASRRWRRARSASKFADRTQPDGQARRGDDRAARLRGGAARAADVRQRRPRAHGALRHRRPSTSPRIGGKNHKHSVNNPYSQFQDEYTLEEILAARRWSTSRSPSSSAAHLGRRGARRSSRASASSTSTACGDRRVEIVGLAMTTDMPSDVRRAAARSSSSATT